jgi:hypothetical protein
LPKDKSAAATPQDQRDWGTPDPRDGAAYPSPDSTSPPQWAWELLRRRADYRKAWSEIVEPFCDPKTGEPDEARIMSAQNPALYMDSRGYLRTGIALPPYVKVSPDGKKFSMTPPQQELANRFDLQWSGASSLDPHRGEAPGFRTNLVRAHPWRANFPDPTPIKKEIKRGEVLITFNVAWPLDVQLESARLMLQRYAQRDGFSEAAEKQPRWEMFPLYLRVLDAKAAGLSDAEAATILFPDATNVYPDYDGKKKVSNARQSAARLQHEYLFVACAT